MNLGLEYLGWRGTAEDVVGAVSRSQITLGLKGPSATFMFSSNNNGKATRGFYAGHLTRCNMCLQGLKPCESHIMSLSFSVSPLPDAHENQANF